MNHAPSSIPDQALRDAMRPSPASEVLRARLLATARRCDRPRPTFRPLLLASAAALVMTFGGLIGQHFLRTAGGGIPLEAVVSPAALEFADPQDLNFRGQACQGKGCGDWARIQAGFKAPLPAGIAESELSAGGACRVGGHAAAHYLLHDGRMVYVFSAPLRDCPWEGRRTLQRESVSAQAWNEAGRGYLLLAKR